ncbi:hypothetical protein Tco_0414746 [Tanacetum coccineum]
MRALYSSYIACFQLESRKAWNGDLGIGEEVVTCKLYLGLAFTVPTLECVTIGCCEMGGGGGGGRVIGGVGVVCGDGVDSGVVGVVYGVVCGFFVGLFVVVFVGNWSHGAEGNDSFIKCDMTRNDDFVGVQVKAPISTMIVSVPEKDRWCGTRGKFVRDVIVDGGGGEDINVTRVTKTLMAKENGYKLVGRRLRLDRQ